MLHLPDNLASITPKDLIVFDGECVLCSGFYQFMLKRDRRNRFAFATAQSPLGQSLYQALGQPVDAFETNLVIIDGRVYQRMDAFAAAMQALGTIWHLPALVRFLPRRVKDSLYFTIARNRFRWFGRHKTCLLPTKETKARFAKGGF